ncbi:DedA family protein [Paenibacillus sp. JX-17]|uniref:DedA family protein n=1 Tax=Paenibacillus lacisoli TaxID=3064525 RepID=A0ABT9CEE9_9BACL|nr:DedA family protein [Paenibacillus sp. JX-17]MDO7905983.1 DedA family protein [Paenibacillus sp. JX-17]
MGEVVALLLQYGYAAMFGLLALGMVGLPVPDELLMLAFGGLAAQGKYHFLGALSVTFLGSMTGMMLSYGIGRLAGKPALHKYGKWIRLTPARIQASEKWFGKYGPWGLLFGYFVPGLRHLCSYLAGTTALPISRYVSFASLGAALWCTTFLWIGHACGMHWDQVVVLLEPVTKRLGVITLLIVLVIAGIIALRKKWWKVR